MYKRASENAQQRLQSGRGKLSGAGKPTVRMTGPDPLKVRLKKEKKRLVKKKKAAQLREKKEAAVAKRGEEQRLKRERARQELHERRVQQLQQRVRENLLGKGGD